MSAMQVEVGGTTLAIEGRRLAFLADLMMPGGYNPPVFDPEAVKPQHIAAAEGVTPDSVRMLVAHSTGSTLLGNM